MPIKATIDIGTNSTRLLIADFRQPEIEVLRIEERLTRLGEGVGVDRLLTGEGMERVIAALLAYRVLIDQHDAVKVRVVATSATREARNKDDFLQLIHSRTGLTCQVLTGPKEAEYSFRGAMSDFQCATDTLVCDIGGGSSEFVLGRPGEIQFQKSLKIGSRRMTAQYHLDEAITSEYFLRIQSDLLAYLREHLPELTVPVCVLVGGTATTLAMMDAQVELDQAPAIHHNSLGRDRLQQLIQVLWRTGLQEKRNLRGLHPDRADVILAGALIVDAVLQCFSLDRATVSLRDLMYGIWMA